MSVRVSFNVQLIINCLRQGLGLYSYPVVVKASDVRLTVDKGLLYLPFSGVLVI